MQLQVGLDQETEKRIDATAEETLERLHRVIIHNDEVTPYEFVIIVLRRFFQLALPDLSLFCLCLLLHVYLALYI